VQNASSQQRINLEIPTVYPIGPGIKWDLSFMRSEIIFSDNWTERWLTAFVVNYISATEKDASESGWGSLEFVPPACIISLHSRVRFICSFNAEQCI